MFRAVVLSDGEMLTSTDFPQIATQLGIQQPAPENRTPTSFGNGSAQGASLLQAREEIEGAIHAMNASGHLKTLEEVEGEMIQLAIETYSGHMSEVARRLGIGRSTLYRKVRDLGLDRDVVNS